MNPHLQIIDLGPNSPDLSMKDESSKDYGINKLHSPHGSSSAQEVAVQNTDSEFIWVDPVDEDDQDQMDENN